MQYFYFLLQLKNKLQYPSILHFITMILFVLCIFLQSKLTAQQSFIKCYFNHPVNTTISSGANATYLNGTFPDTIAAYINRAKYSIDIAMYNYTAFASSKVARIATAANAAAARGVLVRWIYNGTSATNNTGLALLNSSIKTFAAPNNSGYIMHNKFMVIDVNSADSTEAILQTGSYNFSDAQTSDDYNNIIVVQNKQVALAYYREFNKMWGGTGANPNPVLATFSTTKTASDKNIFLVGEDTVAVYFSPNDHTSSHLKNAISTANYDLFFGVYTFTDNGIANLIKTAFNTGKRVRGIMDKNSLPYNAYATLNPVLGSNLIIYSGSFLYHDKVMLIDALNPSSDPQVFTGSYNWTTQAEVSNDENSILVHSKTIANQYYQSMCNNYTGLGGTPCVAAPCTAASTIFISNIIGASYQWQLNTGSGFTNITDNGTYSGTNTVNLVIANAAGTWYGFQYRCLVGGNVFSDTSTLKFTAYWNGSVNTSWENPLNWNCGAVPDANTDVEITNSVPQYPIINSSTACRSLRLNKNASILLINGINLVLSGR
jgi:PLD-like domain